jgi:hypothetical protein
MSQAAEHFKVEQKQLVETVQEYLKAIGPDRALIDAAVSAWMRTVDYEARVKEEEERDEGEVTKEWIADQGQIELDAATIYDPIDIIIALVKINGDWDGDPEDEDFDWGHVAVVAVSENPAYVDAVIKVMMKKVKGKQSQKMQEVANSIARNLEPAWSAFDDVVAEHADLNLATAWFDERGDPYPDALEDRIRKDADEGDEEEEEE